MAKRKMSALQKKYFGAGHKSHFKKKTSGVVMARRRSFRRAASAGRRRAGGIGGKFGGMIPPLLGGAADGIIGTPFGIDGIGSAAVGFFMKSTTTRDIGLNRVGRTLAGKFMAGGLFGFLPSGQTAGQTGGGDLY